MPYTPACEIPDLDQSPIGTPLHVSPSGDKMAAKHRTNQKVEDPAWIRNQSKDG